MNLAFQMDDECFFAIGQMLSKNKMLESFSFFPQKGEATKDQVSLMVPLATVTPLFHTFNHESNSTVMKMPYGTASRHSNQAANTSPQKRSHIPVIDAEKVDKC